MLGLPLNLKFSHVSKLKVKIPWKSISTSSTEIILQGLYIVLTPVASAEWNFAFLRSFQSKFESVEAFADMLLNKIIEKEKEN